MRLQRMTIEQLNEKRARLAAKLEKWSGKPAYKAVSAAFEAQIEGIDKEIASRQS